VADETTSTSAAVPVTDTDEVRVPPAPPLEPAGDEPGRPTAPVRVRARLARFTAQRHQANPVLDPLFRSIRATHPKADLGLVERAYAATPTSPTRWRWPASSPSWA